jgi:hypothetical protein
LVDLSYFQGFTHEEISKALEYTIGNGEKQDKNCFDTIKNNDPIDSEYTGIHIKRDCRRAMFSGLLLLKKEESLRKAAINTPELLAARTAFELALEKQAMENAIASSC